jgi:hypothetical protein
MRGSTAFGTLAGVLSMEKVTVSLPPELLARIEERRQRLGGNRSETITDLLWRGWRLAEDEARAERYRAAYAAQPATAEDKSLAEAGVAELLGTSESWPEGVSAARSAAPKRKPAVKNRQSRS